MMQRLWTLNLQWDKSLPQELHSKWKNYQASWDQLRDLKIPRQIKDRGTTSRIIIHGFSDASERAYGTCLYAMTRTLDGKFQSQLLCAKTRVAPLKVITIAKLELCAALLLAKLYKTVQEALGNKIADVRFWSDSTIVLGWIRTCPSTLKTFIANRVPQIQTLGSQHVWHHVPSAENPADILSKGTIEELQTNRLWWHGPWWLQEENSWPEQPSSVKELPEKKTVVSFVTTIQASEVLPSVSTFKRLTRIVAYCYRFGARRKSKVEAGALTVAEFTKAEAAVVRIVQREAFAQEYRDLQKGQQVKINSQLAALDPFLVSRNLICIGGRLQHLKLTEEAKHPIVLPSKHQVTRLIFKDEHVRLHHCGAEQLLASVRQKYWVLSGRKVARKTTRSCEHCFQWRPSSLQVKMSNLPEARVANYVRPFAITGVDYAGPIKIKESRRRERVHSSKAYIALFICFHTKAVRLELVTDLTTESFLSALRRFTGRRGNCSQLHSDNATNFIGAERELREIYDFLREQNEVIQAKLVNQKIEWYFIPPRALNFGGLWESNIKSMKKHFYGVTKGLTLTFEECYTLYW